jgi:hypothetical protein
MNDILFLVYRACYNLMRQRYRLLISCEIPYTGYICRSFSKKRSRIQPDIEIRHALTLKQIMNIITNKPFYFEVGGSSVFPAT